MGYWHWGKVLAVEGSECMIKWQTDKKPSSHSITDVFLTEAAARDAFGSIASSDSASEPPFSLCIQSLTLKLLTHKCPYAQLHRRLLSQGHCEVVKSCTSMANLSRCPWYAGYLPSDQSRCDNLWKVIVRDKQKASQIRLSPVGQARHPPMRKRQAGRYLENSFFFCGCVVSTWNINDSDAHCLPVYTSSIFWLLSGDLFSDAE